MSNNEDCHGLYRQITINQIRSKENVSANFMDDVNNGGFLRYLDKMSKPGEWGGHLELLALSEALGVKFCLITEDKQRIWINMNPNDGIRTIFLAYHRTHLHYFSIKKEEKCFK